jgi:hypothetical protein
MFKRISLCHFLLLNRLRNLTKPTFIDQLVIQLSESQNATRVEPRDQHGLRGA